MRPPAETGSGRTGGWRLADRSSSYLRSAAEQPIEWYPWGPEPFELAKRTGRPILLDIGASWCHWCHVMDEGTYSDPEVARLLLQHFVAVKVDRDEHPEIDRRYQRQVGALTGEGGWPLTGFLTPEGEVFLGGTYFPPGRAGSSRIPSRAEGSLPSLPRGARTDPRERPGDPGRPETDARIAFARRPPARHVRRERSRGGPLELRPGERGLWNGAEVPPPDRRDVPALGRILERDRLKFRAGSRDARSHGRRGVFSTRSAAAFIGTLSTEGWHIPHFEKMGVDNAALLSAYTEGAARFQDPRLEEVVRSTIGWVREVLADPRGGFGASQDADNAPGRRRRILHLVPDGAEGSPRPGRAPPRGPVLRSRHRRTDAPRPEPKRPVPIGSPRRGRGGDLLPGRRRCRARSGGR